MKFKIWKMIQKEGVDKEYGVYVIIWDHNRLYTIDKKKDEQIIFIYH